MAFLECLSMGCPLPSSDAMPTVGERRLISLRAGSSTRNRLEGIEQDEMERHFYKRITF